MGLGAELLIQIFERGAIITVGVYLIFIAKRQFDRIEEERKKQLEEQEQKMNSISGEIDSILGLLNTVHMTLKSIEEELIMRGKDTEVLRERISDMDRSINLINTTISIIQTKLDQK